MVFVRKKLPNHLLHGFGVDRRLLRNPLIYNTLESADSTAWSMAHGQEYQYAKSPEDLKTGFVNFSTDIENLHRGPIDLWVGE